MLHPIPEVFSSAKYAGNKSLFGCPQKTGTYDLVCKDGECSTDLQCVTATILNIWARAGFSDYVFKGYSVAQRINKLHEKYGKMKKDGHLKFSNPAKKAKME